MRIEQLQLVWGRPVLVDAAEEAVPQWTYRQVLINGRIVDVVTGVEVPFDLVR